MNFKQIFDKVKSWSHSALELYEQCPFKFQMLKVTKEVKDERGEAAIIGDEDHKSLEARLKHGTPLIPRLAKLEQMCAQLLTLPGTPLVEAQYAVDGTLKPCRFKDWNNGWLRGIIDWGIINGTHADVFDWKSGKPKDNFNQLKIFAILIFLWHPQVQTVRCRYIWYNHGKITPEDPNAGVFKREELQGLLMEQLHRVKSLQTAHETGAWPGITSGLCKNYCPVSKAGRCPYYGG